MARKRFFDDEEMQPVSGRTLLRLLAYLAPHKGTVALAITIVLFTAVAAQLGPYLMKVAVDVYVPAHDLRGLVILAAAFAAVIGVGALAVRWRQLLMVRMGNAVIEGVRRELFHHVNHLAFSFFDERPAGKIIHRIMVYVDRLQQMVKNGIVAIVADVLRIFIIVAFMFVISPSLALVALSVTPFLALFVFLVKGRIHRLWDDYQYKSANLNAYAHESFIGIKVTQAFVRERRNSRTWAEQLGQNYSSWMSAVTAANLLFPAVLVFNTVSIALIYWFGYRFLGLGTASLGSLIAFTSYVWMLTDPIVDLSNYYNDVLVALAAADRIFDYLDTPVAITDPPDAYPLPPCQGRVEFQEVRFGYDQKTPVLHGISFQARPGATVAFVGRTGAGKSTIINLLSRFYEITGGKILIDGHDIRKVTVESLRAQVGVMMQDPFVFSGTIADNIRYGRLDATAAEIQDAARAVRAHEFISELPGGYDAAVNEAGNNLSVGQKQLLSFARILLMDPRILILDEATASIDTKTERLLQEAIRRILMGRTSFVIAHRLSTIENADVIYVLEDGRIVEQGTHAGLLQSGGRYARLSASQRGALETLLA